ncbi:MAG TPA: thioredoxin-disulfide reductase [Eubacterium sp.]|nr:thioredoxin-disulfide reductase [Eubacterium sp.]
MYDIIIIGSGPAGLSAAIYAKRANLNVAVAEKEYEGTGQIAESGNVNNYLGLPNINGYDLGEKFREHAVSLNVEFIEKEAVQIEAVQNDECAAESAIYRVKFDDDTIEEARALIYTAGAYPRKAGVPGEDEYTGKGVSYCAICDGAFYKGKTVAVLGGGDTALDDALYLADICEKVYLVHRRDSFRGAQSTVELLKQKENVELVLNETVIEIYGEKKPTGIKLKSGRELALDGVFVAYGSVPQSKLLKNLVQLDERGYVVAGEDGITYAATKKADDDRRIQPGLYVAGDVRTKTLRQVVTAVSDGANAATTAAEYLLRDIN